MPYPLVSVIIPTFNCAKYICHAIDSVISQTYPNVEIIVVDDGSTDNTLQVLKDQYDDMEPRFPFIILHKKNGGTASALNKGIEVSHGKWIHWLSSDDMLLPGAVEKMLIGIDQYSEEQKQNSIFYSHYYIVDENGEKTGEFVEKNRNDKTLEEFQQDLTIGFQSFCNFSSTMIHRSIFDKTGLFNTTIPYFEDYEFIMRCVILYNIKPVLIPEFTLLYRHHPAQLSKKVDISWNKKIIDGILSQK